MTRSPDRQGLLIRVVYFKGDKVPGTDFIRGLL
jgi:hypothetical protein